MSASFPSVAAPSMLLSWVSILVFGFPVAMVLLGEAIRRLQRRHNPILAAVQILRNWVMPSLTLQILLVQVMGLSRSTTVVRLAETMLWISLIYGALTLLNSILFEGASQGSWQAKVPQLFRDLGRFLLVLLGSSIVLSTVWGADLGGFLTALGVGSLVLGLALQDSLGNIFSGVALLFEQPVRLGDWVEIDGTRGLVVELNWRAVHLLNGDQNLVVVPNSELSKTSFTNLSRPSRTHIQSLSFHFSLEDPPNLVKQMLQDSASIIPGVLPVPAPTATLTSYNESSITYSLEVCCQEVDQAGGLADEILARVWYVSRRQGFTMPYPTRVLASALPSSEAHVPDRERQCLQALHSSLFAKLPPAVLRKLANSYPARSYGAAELVLQQGAPIRELSLILQGEAELLWQSPGGSSPLTVGILGPGECFGESVVQLHTASSQTTVRARTDLLLLQIDADNLASLADLHPYLTRELHAVGELRRQTMASQQRELV